FRAVSRRQRGVLEQTQGVERLYERNPTTRGQPGTHPTGQPIVRVYQGVLTSAGMPLDPQGESAQPLAQLVLGHRMSWPRLDVVHQYAWCVVHLDGRRRIG